MLDGVDALLKAPGLGLRVHGEHLYAIPQGHVKKTFGGGRLFFRIERARSLIAAGKSLEELDR